MQHARFRQEYFLLVEFNNAKSTSPAVSSGQERGLLSRTAAGNRAYGKAYTVSFHLMVVYKSSSRCHNERQS